MRSMRPRHVFMLALLCLGAFAALAISCGDDDSKEFPPLPTVTRTSTPHATEVASTSTSVPTPAATATPTAPATIVIGMPLSLTGATATEGNQAKNGIEMWVAAVNAAGGLMVGATRHPVEVRIYDDGSVPSRSAEFAERLIAQDKVSFLFGPYGSGPTLAVEKVAEARGVPLVVGNGASEALFTEANRWTVGVNSTSSAYLHSVIDFALAQSPAPRTVAILGADDAFSLEVAAAAKTYAESVGLEVVHTVTYKSNETELSAQVAEVAAFAPDLVINAGHLQEAIAIRQQAALDGLQPLLFAFSVGPALPEFASTLGAAAEGVVTGSQWSAAVGYQGNDPWGTAAAYAAAYRARYGSDAAYQAASATAAGLALQAAIEAAGSIEPGAVRNALRALDIETFYGPVAFNARGVNDSKPMVVEQIQGGQRVTIWPAEVAAGDAVWPTPY